MGKEVVFARERERENIVESGRGAKVRFFSKDEDGHRKEVQR